MPLKTVSRPLRHQRQPVPSPHAVCILGLFVFICGCGKSPAPEFRFNEVEFIKQERTQLAQDEHFPDRYKKQIGNLLTALFGTPDDPKFPNRLGVADDPVVDIDNLKVAAGSVKSDRLGKARGLYREHCAHCHGITGDGAGPTAAFLNPYPRDFRLGKFKFKSTPLRQAPTDRDLDNILRNGIPGTAMPSFRALDQDKIDALVDYVKYLTIRGQFERRLIAELGNLDGEPLLDVSWIEIDEAPASSEPSFADRKLSADEISAKREAFQDQLYDIVSGFLNDEGILDRWYEADDEKTEVPSPSELADFKHPDHQELIALGKTLFAGKANCVQCHGVTGLGDGQVENFDDWVNDWGKTRGVDLFESTTYADFVEAGAMLPRPIRPRNLRMPVFRGGSHHDDVYRRIANGIEGTPMPSSPALSSDEIWALVAYVKALPYEPTAQQAREKPVNDQAIR